jgi:hypothetical protein
MALSRTQKVTLAAALIAAMGAIIAALLSNTSNISIIQHGQNNTICADNSRCNQGG